MNSISSGVSAEASSLRRTLLALRVLARARTADALGDNVEGFLKALEAEGPPPEKIAAVKRELDAWLAHALGTLLVRVARLLHDDQADLETILEVLRASWTLSSQGPGHGRSGLARIGVLLSTSLTTGDRRGAREAVMAARSWWESQQGELAAEVRRGVA